MRGALFWLIGAAVAFFVTAGAFLLLANIGIAPKASVPIPRSEAPEQGPEGPELILNFSEERLEALERRRNQTLTIYLENKGDEELESVDLELRVSSEGAASRNARRYGETVLGLAPGEMEEVALTVDLSPAPPVEGFAVLGQEPGGDREILEARAYALGEPVVVETAVLSP